MKDILQCKNGLNKLELGKMTSREQDVFFYILFLLSKNKLEPLEITFLDLKKKIGAKDVNNPQFVETVKKMVKKFQSSVQEYEISEGEFLIFNVLDDTRINTKKGTITTSLKKAFRELLEIEEKSKCYMSLNLKEMCNLKSSYLKILYRYFKQWESVGERTLTIEEFKNMLDIPKSYKLCDIDKRILDPAIKEFKDIFKGFRITKDNDGKKGKRISSLTFTWQRVVKKKTKKQEDREQEKNITAAKKIFNKEVAAEKTARVEDEIQDIKAREKLAEIVNTNLTNKTIAEKAEKITSNEYELMYQDFVKANGGVNSIHTRRGFDIMNRGKYEIISDGKKAQ